MPMVMMMKRSKPGVASDGRPRQLDRRIGGGDAIVTKIRTAILGAAALTLLASCGPRTEPYRTAPLPTAQGFRSAVPAGHTVYDNASLADLFVRLTHRLENGDSRKWLQRFEKPVNVGMVGPGAGEYVPFLKDLLGEIRREARIDISAGAAPHNLLIQFVPGEEFLPKTSNQCMVVFGQPDWTTLIDDPLPYSGLATTRIDRQETMSVIIPDTIEPYKVRECLLEEITQALGTANDLYGLASTIFNDDNAHSWPTRLDYLMLRVLYHPEMKSGLDPDQTRALALRLLDEMNPDGRGAPPLPTIEQERFKQWRLELLAQDKIEDPVVAVASARRLAVRARRMAPDSVYDCTGITFAATVARHFDAPDAADLLDEALATCRRVVGPEDIRIAQLRLQKAYAYLDQDNYADARREVEDIVDIFKAHALDGNVAAAYIIQTAAAWKLNDPNWDGEILKRAADWSAFAYGDDHELTTRLRPN